MLQQKNDARYADKKPGIKKAPRKREAFLHFQQMVISLFFLFLNEIKGSFTDTDNTKNIDKNPLDNWWFQTILID